MRKLQTNQIIGRLIALLLIAVVPMAGRAQAASPCTALVQVERSLWLVRADGTPLARVATGLPPGNAAALSPGGNVIAYSGKDSPEDVTLVDGTGRLIANIDLHATDAITGLSWMTPTLLRAEEHLSPRAGRFHFVRLGPGNTAEPLRVSGVAGSDCALSADGKDVACIIGDATVDLNGREVYSGTDPPSGGVMERSSMGDYAFEGGIAWDPRGRRLALVEVDGLGQRTWILLDRDGGRAATAAVDAREPLPVAGPVRSIAFTSDTHLRIEGATEVFDQDLPAQGKVPPGGHSTITPGLPRELMVRSGPGATPAPVKGWSCAGGSRQPAPSR